MQTHRLRMEVAEPAGEVWSCSAPPSGTCETRVRAAEGGANPERPAPSDGNLLAAFTSALLLKKQLVFNQRRGLLYILFNSRRWLVFPVHN